MTDSDRALLAAAGLTVDGRAILKDGKPVATISTSPAFGCVEVRANGRVWLGIKSHGGERSAVERYVRGEWRTSTTNTQLRANAADY